MEPPGGVMHRMIRETLALACSRSILSRPQTSSNPLLRSFRHLVHGALYQPFGEPGYDGDGEDQLVAELLETEQAGSQEKCDGQSG